MGFVANFRRFPAVQKVWKSVKIWQYYRQLKGGNLFSETRCSSVGCLCRQHLDKWPKSMPICVHAEGQTLAAVLMLAQLCQRPLHVCHVATKTEVHSSDWTVFIHTAKRADVGAYPTLCAGSSCPMLVMHMEAYCLFLCLATWSCSE